MRNSKLLIVVLLIAAIMASALPVAATKADNSSDKNQTAFKDISKGHWAYDAVLWMTGRKILAGYGDKTFRPDNSVTRGEFAVMMVKALELDIIKPQTASFKDVPKGSWAFQYVESAKYYLTGYKMSDGDYFRLDRPAVREDMAVALVKALNYADETPDYDVLDDYSDAGEISPNLKKYVTIAITKKIMQGSPANSRGLREFNPQDTLTRAEAAVLLYGAIKDKGEKVTYDKDKKKEEEKVTYDDEDKDERAELEVTGVVDGDAVVLSWTKAEADGFNYYKVVASSNNKNPGYPDDGYLICINDRNTLSARITLKDRYNGGDFGGSFKPGERYYFSVTAVYKDEKVKGNAVRLAFPEEEEYEAPKVTGRISGERVILEWEKISDSRLKGYRVVISGDNPEPVYPDDGYFQYITDKSRTYAVVRDGDQYNGGDIDGRLESGNRYYFSVTAVYEDGSVRGNAVRLELP